jgi:hypothetical protein
MRRTAALATLVMLASPAFSRPGGSGITLSGEATIIALDGRTRADSALRDLDTISADGSTTITAGAWKALLSAGTKGILRTERVGADFRRLFEISSGSVALSGAWTLRAGTLLVTAASGSVEASYNNGLLIINVASGDSVQIVGSQATLTLKNGQKLQIKYDVASATFTIQVDADDGSPIDVKIGQTTFQVDKGDIVTAQVSGNDLIVKSVAGDFKLIGPDGQLQSIAPQGQLQVPDGGIGAVKGRGAPLPKLPINTSVPPSPKPPIFKDRTDISPS